jgi:hypothetical protein
MHSNIPSVYLENHKTCGECILDIKCVASFSATFAQNIFLSAKGKLNIEQSKNRVHIMKNTIIYFINGMQISCTNSEFKTKKNLHLTVVADWAVLTLHKP